MKTESAISIEKEPLTLSTEEICWQDNEIRNTFWQKTENILTNRI